MNLPVENLRKNAPKAIALKEKVLLMPCDS